MNTFKNPVFVAFLLFVGGIALGIWGWIKNESLSAEQAEGSTTMIIIAVGMIVSGLVVWATQSGKPK